MYRVTKQYRTETGHRLTDYDGKCAHLHGHSYLWEVTAESPGVTPNGLVIDFKDLKAAMVDVLETLDHCLVLHMEDPLLKMSNAVDLLRATNGSTPRLLAFPFNPTAENFANWAAGRIQAILLDGSTWETPAPKIVEVTVWETDTSFATWRAE